MKVTMLLLILMLLPGCGAAAVGTEKTATSNQPTATTEVERSTRASQPTATAEAVATGTQPEPTTSGSPSSDDVLAVWARSGGFAGLHEVLTVFADGRLSLEQKGMTKNGQAAPADLDRLQQTFGGSDWQQLEKRYGVQHPDAFQYTIQAQGKTVETFDGSDNPQVLTDLLQQFQTLHQSMVSTPGAGGVEDDHPRIQHAGTLWVYELSIGVQSNQRVAAQAVPVGKIACCVIMKEHTE